MNKAIIGEIRNSAAVWLNEKAAEVQEAAAKPEWFEFSEQVAEVTLPNGRKFSVRIVIESADE